MCLCPLVFASVSLRPVKLLVKVSLKPCVHVWFFSLKSSEFPEKLLESQFGELLSISENDQRPDRKVRGEAEESPV